MTKSDNSETNGQKEVSPRQKKVIAALLNSRTIEEALKVTGTARNTLHQWMKQEHFKAQLRSQQDIALEEAVHALKSNLTKAIQVLSDLLDSKNEAVKRGAANDMLTHMFKFREFREIEDRLIALEKAVPAKKGWR